MQNKPASGKNDKSCESHSRPVVNSSVDEMSEGYRAMAADHVRETEALVWAESICGDAVDDEN